MYFDFDERYESVEPVGGAVTRRDGVLASVVVHALVIALVLVLPELGLFPERRPQPVPAAEAERERPQFVFVQPQLDLKAEQPKPNAAPSDQDRVARAPEPPPPDASNPLPFARGNSAERVEAAPNVRARGNGPAPDPAPESPSAREAQPQPEVPSPSDAMAFERPAQPPRPAASAQAPPPGGALGDALKNLQKYIDQESFGNQQGNVQDMGPLQFDTKGVEFGPWVRRFVAQVRRNWFIPYAAMAMQGKVVLQFNVHKNGRITDLAVVGPSSVDSFNTAAFNALSASDPTEPLPPEYPDEKAFFTVTFFYNQTPEGPGR
ncbi:MAG: TonB family protein [Vicinamibacterales bacterium]